MCKVFLGFWRTGSLSVPTIVVVKEHKSKSVYGWIAVLGLFKTWHLERGKIPAHCVFAFFPPKASLLGLFAIAVQ